MNSAEVTYYVLDNPNCYPDRAARFSKPRSKIPTGIWDMHLLTNYLLFEIQIQSSNYVL